MSLAFHLAKAGAGHVMLLEQNHLASGPTGKSGAMIRPLFTEAVYIHLVQQATGMFGQWSEVGGRRRIRAEWLSAHHRFPQP